MSPQDVVRTRECAYNIVIEPAEEGGYVVTCPSLRGLATQGETLEEARAMAADAIEGYLELLREDGLPLPASDEPSAGPFRDRVTIKLQTG
ncbi:MAG TPA: type II toxin-antitoxin system HicB family antitoxin [Rhodospirillales bacterium]|nr:type II toxin-antitoxin system HicB family antitoxin [Rhodospirillales bacterium]